MGKAVQLCCCCSLRAGSIVIASLQLFGALLYTIAFVLIFDGTYKTTMSPITLIIMFKIKLWEGILLICGAIRKNVDLCYAWMVLAVIEGIVDLATAALYFLAAAITGISKSLEDDDEFSSRKSRARKAAEEEEITGNYVAGGLHLIVIAVLIYYFFVVLNFTFEVKEERQLAFRPGDQQRQGYAFVVGSQMGPNGYAPNYNQYPSYTAQAAMYPQGQGQPSQHPSTQGMNPKQNPETPAPTPE